MVVLFRRADRVGLYRTMTFHLLRDYIGKKMPRREGDVENPRGGVRHLMPGEGEN